MLNILKSLKLKKTASIATIFFGYLLCQNINAVNIQQFSRSNSLVFEMLEDSRMENSHVYSDYDAIFTLGGSWVDNPFVLKSSNNSSVTGEPLPSLKTIHFGAGIYFTNWLMLGLTSGYSFYDWKSLNSSGATVDSGAGSSMSDIEIKTKIRFLREAMWALSVMPFITVPTGNGSFDPISTDAYGKNKFLSDNGLGVGVKLLGEYLFSFMQVVANVGIKHNNEAKYSPDLDYSDMLYTGIGAYVPLTDSIGANVEYVRQWQLPFKSDQNPNETYLGLSAGITRRLHAFAGIGFGNLFQKSDGNDWRASAGIKYIPLLWSKEQEPIANVTREDILKAVEEKTSPTEALQATPVADPIDEKTHYVFNNKSNTAVIRFPHNSSLLKNNTELKTVAEALATRNNLIQKIIIIGHTSLVGPEDLNHHLSLQRAEAVKKVLLNEGISENIIHIEPKGESDPLINDESDKANAINRRVEFKVELIKDN